MRSHAKTIQIQRKRKTSQPIETESLPRLSSLPLTIESQIFNKTAAYSAIESKSSLSNSTLLDESLNYSRLSMFTKVDYYCQNQRKDLRYGDFIQIRSQGAMIQEGSDQN